MKEYPILFNSDMVRAIKEGRKTQTRRLWKNFQPMANMDKDMFIRACPYGQPGDRLWVRETWNAHGVMRIKTCGVRITYAADREEIVYSDAPDGPLYCADDNGNRPSIHMPRWASRIDLEVVSVGRERVQEISEQDAQAEGMDRLVYGVDYDAETGYKPVPFVRSIDDEDDDRIASFKGTFHFTWDSIYSKRGMGWDVNPYVWVVKFEEV